MEARAKVNLYLRVGKRRPDGYHEIQTIFHSISLSDSIRIRPGYPLTVSCTTPGCPEGSANISYRAAQRMAERSGVKPEAQITIEKRIPMQAGLGGGSADAAATLVGLNELWKTGASDEELAEMGVKLGADVPFCLKGGAAYAEGIGERLTPLPPIPDGWLVVVMPEASSSTRSAYAELDAQSHPAGPDPEAALEAVRSGDASRLGPVLYNDFEPVIMRQSDAIYAAKSRLQELLPNALLCGSGAALFALASSEEEAVHAAAALKQESWNATAARFAPSGWTMKKTE